MRKLALIALGIFSILHGYSQAWVKQQSNTTSNLLSVYFIDPDNGFAAGHNGTMLKTSDGGENWVLKSTGITHGLNSVLFTDSLTGFAVSCCELLKTTDGGETWVIQDTMMNSMMCSVFFVGKDTGFVSGNGRMLVTYDKGATWNKQKSASLFVNCFWAANSKTLFMGGENFLTLKSTDGGVNWFDIVPYSSFGRMESIFFTDENTGFFVGGGWAQGNTGSFFGKTTDGGATLTYPLANIGKWLSCIFFADSTTGYMTAHDGSILKTTNAGTNWTLLNSEVSCSLNSIFFSNSDVGYAVGDSGTILKTTQGGVGIVQAHSAEKLVSIYPNPATDVLAVELCFGPWEKSEIAVYTISGQLVLREETTGTKTMLNIKNLPKGIYILKIATAGSTEVVKFNKV
jgi:photosystem II stability/assembly factor-like uncharacterized protein